MPSSLAPRRINRLARKIRHITYTAWGHLGSVSKELAIRIPLAGPPILILSLPRSGSSWLGALLSTADHVLYLREPISQARRRAGEPFTLVDIDVHNPSRLVKTASDRAFAGIPRFPPIVLGDPRPWQLSMRRQQRLVIKEVNPLASAFWLQRYQPTILYLVRHPAAVALSFHKLGWLHNPDVQMDRNNPRMSVWEKVGLRQGYIHRKTLDSLRDYPNYRIFFYEALCLQPIEEFQSVFAFSGLPWHERTRQAVLNHSAGGDRTTSYNTYRNSSALAHAWQGKLETQQLEDLRKGYTRFDLPWYNTLEDWEPEVSIS